MDKPQAPTKVAEKKPEPKTEQKKERQRPNSKGKP